MLPPVPALPPFQAWSYLTRNEVTAEAGSRVFHTNASGAASAVLPRSHALYYVPVCNARLAKTWSGYTVQLTRQLKCLATDFQQLW